MDLATNGKIIGFGRNAAESYNNFRPHATQQEVRAAYNKAFAGTMVGMALGAVERNAERSR